MHLFGRDVAGEVAIVAEVGVNHEGDVEAASRLVRLAAEAGADAVKFQSYTPARYCTASDPVRLARVTRFALDREAHERLAAEATALGIAFLSTPVTEDWVPILAGLCPALKIASGDLVFEAVIRAAARTGKPVILSAGGGELDEIDQAVEWVADEVGRDALAERLVLMHCVSAYPTPVDEANVRSVGFLSDRYGLVTGYSNHVVGPEACLAAVALGARVIEVHFTDRREGRTFRDHELSFEPDELAALVRGIPRVVAALGTAGKRRQPSEAGNIAAMRKGVVAARALSAGQILGADDLMFARPATEYAAADLPRLLGLRLTEDVVAGALIRRAAVVEA
ncbi:MAG: N-acetylneuraminate synthase family protein [Proteobacteria bacterium]|nr:N-acetylneuraminate synthase family protein [Pseudomonadota bacterium]MDA1131672.1 N-acetylneuraminate synthase family protein [Pseudomonadota bacterium]